MKNKKPRLPTWASNELSEDPESLKVHIDKVNSITRNVANMASMLNNPPEKKNKNRNKVILLDHDLLLDIKQISDSLELEENDLESYFLVMSELVEATSKLLQHNHSNLCNSVLLRRMKRLYNTLLTETLVMDVVNTYLSVFYTEDEPEAS